MNLQIIWGNETSDGLFGKLSVVDDNGDVKLTCVCDTNLKLRILDGTYTAVIDLSPRLQYKCPHIRVPLRDAKAGGDAGLRIHKANCPSQSLGCIFPGEIVDGDAIDDSKDAFNAVMALLPQDGSEFNIQITSSI